MQLVNLKDASEQVSFSQAVKQGLGRNQGLFFPTDIPRFENIDSPEIARVAKAWGATLIIERPDALSACPPGSVRS